MTHLGKSVEREFYFGADQETVRRAWELRNSMTFAENILWQKLRFKKLQGAIFRRQHPIKYFIVDFYYHRARLVIEVDGEIHDDPQAISHDQNRTAELNNLGLRVIRFTNEQVENDLPEVLRIIARHLSVNTFQQLSAPLPPG
ncbi:MAG: endonuclease domain-containing protein [Bacteroidota bacterium]